MKNISRTAIFVALSFLVILLRPVCAAAAPDTILVGFDPNFPPYQFIAEDQIVGAHIDIMNRISEMQGIEIRYVPLNSGYDCHEALRQGQIDLMLGAVYGQNREPRMFSETQPISQSQLCMFASSDVAQEINTRRTPITASYQDGTVSLTFLGAFRNLYCIAVSNQIRTFGSLLDGRVDAMIGVKSSIDYQLRQEKLLDEYTIVNNYMLPIEFCMLVRSEDQKLLRSINSALYELRISGEYEKIHNSWVDDGSRRWRELLNTLLWTAAAVATLILCFVLFNLRLNILLKRQVAEKTGELVQKNHELEEQIEQTRKSNELQNNIVHSSPNAIVVFDSDLRVTLFNENARKLLEAPQLCLGCLISGIPLIWEFLGDKIETMMVPGIPMQPWETTRDRQDGSRITYRVSLYQLYSPQAAGRTVRGASLTVRDVTLERQLREREFEREKNLALNRLVAGIAHEIRNPLTAIKAYTMMLPYKLGNPEFQSQMVHYVPMEVDRVNSLINNLIDYAKPKSPVKEVVLVDEVLDSSVMLISPLLKGKKIDLRTEIVSGLRLFCDRAQFKQILINLSNNFTFFSGYLVISQYFIQNGKTVCGKNRHRVPESEKMGTANKASGRIALSAKGNPYISWQQTSHI